MPLSKKDAIAFVSHIREFNPYWPDTKQGFVDVCVKFLSNGSEYKYRLNEADFNSISNFHTKARKIYTKKQLDAITQVAVSYKKVG